MGNTYYVDTAGSNTAPYDTWAKASTALATVVAIPPAAGDTIYARGTETLAATVTLASSGDTATGRIKLIGCNASGNVDGTRFVLDGNAAGNHIIDLNAKSWWQFENIEVKNTGGAGKHGFHTPALSSNYLIFNNVCANNCSGYGYNLIYSNHDLIWRCVAYSNSGGFAKMSYTLMFFCCSRDNTTEGYNLYLSYYAFLVGCLAYDNAYGYYNVSQGVHMFNCVGDSNTTKGYNVFIANTTYHMSIIASRITNHSGGGDIGVDLNGSRVNIGYCYFEDNDGNNIQNATRLDFIPVEGGTTTSNAEDQANTNEGYVSLTEGSEDYSTNYVSGTDPTLRRTAITIPTS